MTHNPPSPANNTPDARIDLVLHAIGSTQPAPGLESRIAEHLAAQRVIITRQTIAQPQRQPIFAAILNAVNHPSVRSAPAMRYTAVAASLAAVAALILFSTIVTPTLSHHNPANSTASAAPDPTQPLSTQAPLTVDTRIPQALSTRASRTLSAQVPRALNVRLARNARVPQGFTLGSHTLLKKAGVLSPASTPLPPTDPDAIALAETLAPSHPAPPMPLTPQERLLFAVTRKGQPIEVAELHIALASSLRAAAEARQTATIQQLARRLFAPIALSEALEPSLSEPQETSSLRPSRQPLPQIKHIELEHMQ